MSVSDITRFLSTYKRMTPAEKQSEETCRQVVQFRELIQNSLQKDLITALAQAIRLGEASQDMQWVKGILQRVYTNQEQLDPLDREDLQPIFQQYLKS